MDDVGEVVTAARPKLDVVGRIRRNLAVIAPHVAAHSGPLTEANVAAVQMMVDENNSAFDFHHPLPIYHNNRFYNEDGRKASAQQVASFLLSPGSYRPPVSYLQPEDEITWMFGQELDGCTGTNRMLTTDPDDPRPAQNLDPRYIPKLVVFGIGIGFHIPLLLDQIQSTLLIIVETDPICMSAGLAAIDWAPVIAFAKSKGVTVKFVYHPDPSLASYGAINTIRFSGCAGLVGTRFYWHHARGSIAEAIKHFQGSAAMIAPAPGYFADEFRQVCQTRENLAAGLPLWDRSAIVPLPKTACALVVGSGPSLDRSLELLESLKYKCFIIACGTAIRPLMQRGIRPHCLVNLETHPGEVATVIGTDCTADVYESVTFITSSGTPPNVAQAFNKTFLFARHTSSSSFAMGAVDTVKHAFARVGNAGAAIACYLGFHQIVMVGMDTGLLEDGSDHAAGTFHTTEAAAALADQPFKHFGDTQPEFVKDLKDPRRQAIFKRQGIDGREVALDPVFLFSLSSFNELLREMAGREIYQIGYGAVINGCRNMTPGDFMAALPHIEPVTPLSVWVGLPVMERASARYDANLKVTAKRFGELTEQLIGFYSGPLTCELDFVRMDEAAFDLFESEPQNCPEGAAAGMLRGTTTTCARAALERSFEIADPVERLLYLRTARDCMIATFRRMNDKVQGAFTASRA